jgi:hypothetical protein
LPTPVFREAETAADRAAEREIGGGHVESRRTQQRGRASEGQSVTITAADREVMRADAQRPELDRVSSIRARVVHVDSHRRARHTHVIADRDYAIFARAIVVQIQRSGVEHDARGKRSIIQPHGRSLADPDAPGLHDRLGG